MFASFQLALLLLVSSGFGLFRDAYDAHCNKLESRIADLESWIEGSVSDVYDGVRQHGDGVASEAEQPRRGEALRAPLGRKAEHCRNRLIRRVRASGEIVSLSYDADGNRVGKLLLDSEQAELRSTRYLVDVNNHTGYAQVVEQRTNTGGGFGLDAVYTYGHDSISQDRYQGDLADIASAQDSEYTLSFYLYDGHGTVRGLADESATVTDTYEYDAFGVLLSGSGGTRNDYLYAGEQFDSDLGMYFLRARYLNATSGRFHTMDTYEGRNGEPLTLHKYLYVHANPVMHLDPSGRWSISSLATSMAIGGIINSSLTVAFNMADPASDDLFEGVGSSFFIGAVTAPVGGPIAKVLGKIMKPLSRPFFAAIGKMSPIMLRGKAAVGKMLVNFGRRFVNTNKAYPSVQSTFLGRMMKMAFPKIRWEQHHIYIQQSWSRIGGPNQIFDDLAANEGLRRMGNGLWNLMPIPKGLNGFLGQSPVATQMFATAYYSLMVYGPSQTLSFFLDGDQ